MMRLSDIQGAARLLWGQQMLPLPAGMEVAGTGEYDPVSGNYTDACIRFGSGVWRGTVTFGAGSRTPGEVLCVAPDPKAAVVAGPEVQVLQIPAAIPPALMDLYRRMRSSREVCAHRIASMKEVERKSFFDRLFTERMERKSREMLELWEECERDWNRTLYLGLFKAMGGSDQKHLYMEVARRVPYTAIAHRKESREEVEAMLLGAAGILQTYQDNPYTVRLKDHFDHMVSLYRIDPMQPGAWGNVSNAHVKSELRLVQIAAFLTTREFIFDSVRSCRNARHVYDLFREPVSDYWAGRPFAELGRTKMDLLTINLIAPLMVAYGSVTGQAELADVAQTLVHSLGAESNRKITQWTGEGVPILHADDGQAILELNNEYCNKTLCPVCKIGRNLIKNFENGHTIRNS